MIKQPYLKNYHPSVQLLVLFGIILSSLFLFNFISYLVIRPFLGIDILREGALNDFNDKDVIAAIKTLQFFEIGMGLFLVPSLIFSKLVATPDENFLRTNKKIDVKIMGIVILIALFAIPVLNFLIYINSFFQFPEIVDMEQELEFQNSILLTESFYALLGNILVIAVVPALGEELFFRSILLRFFYRSSRNVHMAIITGGLIFAFIHFRPDQFLPMAVMGILYGYIFFRTGNIWYTVVAHFLNNASGVTFYYLTANSQANENILSYGTGENETIPLVISFLLLTGSVILLFKNADGKEMKNTFY